MSRDDIAEASSLAASIMGHTGGFFVKMATLNTSIKLSRRRRWKCWKGKERWVLGCRRAFRIASAMSAFDELERGHNFGGKSLLAKSSSSFFDLLRSSSRSPLSADLLSAFGVCAMPSERIKRVSKLKIAGSTKLIAGVMFGYSALGMGSESESLLMEVEAFHLSPVFCKSLFVPVSSMPFASLRGNYSSNQNT